MYESTYMKRTARIISGVCGSLFILFIFFYLFVMQADLLATAQHLLSKGQTVYSPLWGACIITLLLLLLQVLFRRLVAYPLRFYVLSYFPSCLVLVMLTSIVPDRDGDVCFSVNWIWFVISFVLHALLTWASLHFPDRNNGKQRVFSLLWVNFLLLALQFCVVGGMSNTNDVYHYKLRAVRYIVQGQDPMALQVGVKSLDADRSLTAMRVFALGRQNQLGESLFEYPQYYGSQGLIPASSDTIYAHDWISLFYKTVGGRPGKDLRNATRFLELLVQSPSATPISHDYLLCAYLLDRNLDAFVRMLPCYYEAGARIPRYYKEALALYENLHEIPSLAYKDSIMETELKDFLAYGMQYSDLTERSNQCRRMYGDTYWWYYYYQLDSVCESDL